MHPYGFTWEPLPRSYYAVQKCYIIVCVCWVAISVGISARLSRGKCIISTSVDEVYSRRLLKIVSLDIGTLLMCFIENWDISHSRLPSVCIFFNFFYVK